MKGVCLCACFEACINYLFIKACEATTGTCRPDLPREREREREREIPRLLGRCAVYDSV